MGNDAGGERIHDFAGWAGLISWVSGGVREDSVELEPGNFWLGGDASAPAACGVDEVDDEAVFCKAISYKWVASL